MCIKEGNILFESTPLMFFNLYNFEVLACKLPSSLSSSSLSKLSINLFMSFDFDGKELSLILGFNYLKSILSFMVIILFNLII